MPFCVARSWTPIAAFESLGIRYVRPHLAPLFPPPAAWGGLSWWPAISIVLSAACSASWRHLANNAHMVETLLVRNNEGRSWNCYFFGSGRNHDPWCRMSSSAGEHSQSRWCWMLLLLMLHWRRHDAVDPAECRWVCTHHRRSNRLTCRLTVDRRRPRYDDSIYTDQPTRLTQPGQPSVDRRNEYQTICWQHSHWQLSSASSTQ